MEASMKIRALALACLLSLLAPAAALADDRSAPPQPDPAHVGATETPVGLAEGGVTVTRFAKDGTVIDLKTLTLSYGSVSDTMVAASASGCLSVDAWKNQYTTLGFLAFRWHQTKYFCWSNGSVYGVQIGSNLSNVDPMFAYRSLHNSDAWYFSWNGKSHGAHYSMRQAHVENCLPVVGCVGSYYPWVKIRTYANGTWTYQVGG
jgi:hypothetical protein